MAIEETIEVVGEENPSEEVTGEKEAGEELTQDAQPLEGETAEEAEAEVQGEEASKEEAPKEEPEVTEAQTLNEEKAEEPAAKEAKEAQAQKIATQETAKEAEETEAPSEAELPENEAEEAPANEDTAKAQEEPAKESAAELDVYGETGDFENMDVGTIVDGTVLAVDEDGVTVDIKASQEGYIKSDDFTRDSHFKITEEVHVGDLISATVIENHATGQIRLSRVDAIDTISWSELTELMNDKATIEVTPREAVKGGLVAYVRGVRGFIPVSKVAMKMPSDLSEYVGKKILVRITEVAKRKRRLVLSARDILIDKEHERRKKEVEKFQLGSVVEGTVERFQSYGAFIKVSDDISGMVHISKISNKRLNHPKEALKEGETVKAKVIGNDDGRLQLSIKALLDRDEERTPNSNKRPRNKQKPSSRYFIDENGEEIEYELPKVREIGTNLGDLIAKLNIKSD